MFSSNTVNEATIRMSRFDPDDPLASYSPHGFVLDGLEWKTAEHYYQATKFSGAYFVRVSRQATPELATKTGDSIFARFIGKRNNNWKEKRQVMMTRAVYTKCCRHPDVAAALLATGDKKIVDCSSYDYFWGIGRDGRGENTYGQVLMNVRNKLREDAA